MKSYNQFILEKSLDKDITDIFGYPLNENFLNRSKDDINNFIHSFKSFIIALKDILEFSYKIDFYKELLKVDLKMYRNNFGYKKNDIERLKDDFDELFDEIDEDLIDSLKLKKFRDDIIDNFDKNSSIDINKKKINNIFDDYLMEVDDYIDETFIVFKNKISKNKNYEPLKNINVVRSKISVAEFEKEKYFLQIEFLKLQEWIKKTKKKVLIIFDGRDAAGKGSAIKTIQQYLDPKHYRVESFGVPSKEESENWFDRYAKALPKDGEIVFFDRSYHVRGYAQPVMGYCSDKEYEKFMDEVNQFEEKISEDIILIKIWLSVSKDVQKLRFELRKSNPLKYWKFSDNDEKVYKKWDDFTEYINKLLKDTNEIKWNIIDSDDNRKCKLEVMKKILDSIDYEHKIQELVNLNKIKKHNIVFMDIDGVLIPYQKASDDYHEYFDDNDKWNEDAIDYMNKLIKKTDAKVVLISSYRKHKSKKEIEKRLKKVGFEYDIWDEISEEKHVERGIQIKEWLKENKHKVNNYVIIDDNRYDYKETRLQPYSVEPDHKVGFNKSEMLKSIEIIEDNEKYKNLINNSVK